jgi:hypothetical protein
MLRHYEQAEQKKHQPKDRDRDQGMQWRLRSQQFSAK